MQLHSVARGCLAAQFGSEAEPGLTDHPRVAISADDSRIALAAPPLWGRYERISVIDAGTGALVQQWPGEGRTLQLRFIDDDRALFTAQAVLGATYEGAAAPSDLRFAIGDLASGDLRNLVDRKPDDNFAREDFLADFSARSRLVRMVQVDADRRDADKPTFRLRVRSADLGRCAIDRDVIEAIAACARIQDDGKIDAKDHIVSNI